VAGVTCNDCKHYRATFETCGKLAARLHCVKCKREWFVDQEGARCGGCSGYRDLVEIADCTGGKPSRWCPGFEAVPPLLGQGTLFD